MTELSRTNRIHEWFDRQARGLAAGMGLAELRALLRGQDPTERPNPRYKAHTNSFLLHVRPRYYQPGRVPTGRDCVAHAYARLLG